MTPVTVAAAMATPVTFAEFRVRLTNADATPCWLRSAALNIEAETGDWKIPNPERSSTIPEITKMIDDGARIGSQLCFVLGSCC